MIVGGRYRDTAIDIDAVVAEVMARIAAENAKLKSGAVIMGRCPCNRRGCVNGSLGGGSSRGTAYHIDCGLWVLVQTN
jgi:hypothetical protein